MHPVRSFDNSEFFAYKSTEEKIRYLLRYAILAPSTHNSQPWKFRLRSDSCEIHKNLDRLLPQADRDGKNMYISLGACIENFILAAKYFNVFDTVEYNSSKNFNDTLVARILFKDLSSTNGVNSKYKELVQAIPKRTTHRGLYTQKKLEGKVMENIVDEFKGELTEIHIITDRPKIDSIANYTKESITELYGFKEFRRELSQWINNNFSRRKEGIPGYALKLPNFISIIFPIILRYFNLSKFISLLNYKSVVSMPVVFIISGKVNSRLTWLEVGRLAERIMLLLTSKDINVYITVAALDVDKSRRQIQKLLNTKFIPQFLFTAGYSTSKQVFTPRQTVDDQIIV